MLVHPQFDPIALSLGPIQIHWYGLTYLVAFGLFLFLAARRVQRPQFADAGWSRRDVEDLLFYGVIGVILGGRIGYALFYKFDHYLSHPLEILAVWKGGMSFHGGLLGVLVAMAVFARRRGRSFLEVTDLIAPCVPTGLASGRVGNFINGELWGRPADPSLPWAMVFPQSGTEIPRHPVAALPDRDGGPAAVRAAVAGTRSPRAGPGRSPVPSWSATACSASSPSTSASPTASSACWPWA